MSLKSIGKQHRLSSSTPSLTPSRTAVTRVVSSLQSHRNSLLSVSTSEHRRVLAKNDAITKENALLKQQLRQLKSDLLASKATQTTNRVTSINSNNNEKLTFESFITALSLMNKINEYVSNGLEDLESELDQMRAIIANCESLVRQNYPQYYAEFQQQNRNTSARTEASGESSRNSGVASKRFPMSVEHRERRRKSLLDTIKQAFHAFTELSTIIEMSKELRPSSVNFSQSSVRSTRATNPTNNSIIGKKSALSDASNTSRNNRMVFCAQTSNSSINSNECNKENINPNQSMASTSMALSPPLHSSSPNGVNEERVCAELESMRFTENDDCTVMPVNEFAIELDNSETQTQPIIRRSKRTAKKLIEYNEKTDENEELIAANGARNGAKNAKTKRKPNPKQTRTRKRNTGKKVVKFVNCDTVSDELPSVYDFSDEMNELPNSFAEYRRSLSNKSD